MQDGLQNLMLQEMGTTNSFELHFVPTYFQFEISFVL